MATLRMRTASLNLLQLTGFRSIRAGMQAVLHGIRTLLALALRKPEAGPF
jgi:ActR/RegA family two-component response regulator